jgi:hypothetical protein
MVTYDGHLFELCNNLIVSDLATVSKERHGALLEIKVRASAHLCVYPSMCLSLSVSVSV